MYTCSPGTAYSFDLHIHFCFTLAICLRRQHLQKNTNMYVYMYVHHVNMYFLCLGRQTEFKIYVDTQYIRILYSFAHMCASTGRFCITPQASHVSRLLTHRHTRTHMCRHNFPINNIKCPRRHFLFDVRHCKLKTTKYIRIY